MLLPNNNRTSSPKRGTTSRDKSPSTSLSFKAKGKQRALNLTDGEEDHSEPETSGELRVRGKERELKKAIQQQLENETRRERQATEEPEEFDPNSAAREKEWDKERIRELEEEIRLLKEEVRLSRRRYEFV
jgi:hypothetical protein